MLLLLIWWCGQDHVNISAVRSTSSDRQQRRLDVHKNSVRRTLLPAVGLQRNLETAFSVLFYYYYYYYYEYDTCDYEDAVIDGHIVRHYYVSPSTLLESLRPRNSPDVIKSLSSCLETWPYVCLDVHDKVCNKCLKYRFDLTILHVVLSWTANQWTIPCWSSWRWKQDFDKEVRDVAARWRSNTSNKSWAHYYLPFHSISPGRPTHVVCLPVKFSSIVTYYFRCRCAITV